MKTFTTQEIEQFVHDHIQSKINHNELAMTGIDMSDKDRFSHEFELYESALFEGVCNGILMCDGKIEGIDTDN